MQLLVALLSMLAIASARTHLPRNVEIALELFDDNNCTVSSSDGQLDIDLTPRNPLARDDSGWFECADHPIDQRVKGFKFVLRDDPPKLEHCRVGVWSGVQCRGGKEGVIARRSHDCCLCLLRSTLTEYLIEWSSGKFRAGDGSDEICC